MSQDEPEIGEATPPYRVQIEVNVAELKQLFNSIDAYSFRERDAISKSNSLPEWLNILGVSSTIHWAPATQRMTTICPTVANTAPQLNGGHLCSGNTRIT
jgi:hypothetical protein